MSKLGIIVQRPWELYYGAPERLLPLPANRGDNVFEDPTLQSGRPALDGSTAAPAAVRPDTRLVERFQLEQPINFYNRVLAHQADLSRRANRHKDNPNGAIGRGVGGANSGSGYGPEHGGGPTSVTVETTGQNRFEIQPPYLTMPETGRPFHFQEAIACPAAGTDDFPVVSFFVPLGWKASIKAVANAFIGTGFDEGSGDLIWRIDIDQAYMPGFERITTSLGTINDSRDLRAPLIAQGGQLVRYTVSVSATAPFGTGSASRILCCFDGYFYPED